MVQNLQVFAKQIKIMKNQTLWETWFVSSLTIFGITFLLGTLSGSKDFMPNYWYYFGISFINVIASLFVGLKKQ